MRIDWDYSAVARSFSKRPPYATATIDAFVRSAGVAPGMRACDAGAGTGNLTLPLLARGLDVVAIEPCEAMRALGRRRTAGLAKVRWLAACAESTGLRAECVDLVTFGSSFNVVDRERALREAARILKHGGAFVCLWNHRRLDDPLQAAIEALIRRCVPAYEQGTRREDQTSIIGRSGFFGAVRKIEGEVVHRMTVTDCVEAWRSHLTLRRQAGKRFPEILDAIRSLLVQAACPCIDVPYTTRAWIARRD